MIDWTKPIETVDGRVGLAEGPPMSAATYPFPYGYIRRYVWQMLCRPQGATIAEITLSLGCSANAVSQQMFALRKAGNKIEILARVGSVLPGKKNSYIIFRAADAEQ